MKQEAVFHEVTADDALVRRVLGGDINEFEHLFYRYQQRVYRLTYRLCGNPSDAEEATQECFVLAFRKLRQFRSDAKFSTWLFRIATNSALMRRRTNRARRAESLDSYLPEFTPAGRHKRIDIDMSAAARIEEVVARRELKEIVFHALQRLPVRLRAAIVLHDLEELSSKEAAAILRIEEATLRQRVHRARLMLRGILDEVVRRKTT